MKRINNLAPTATTVEAGEVTNQSKDITHDRFNQ